MAHSLSWLKQCKQEKFQVLIQNSLAYQVGRSEVLPPGSLKFSMIKRSSSIAKKQTKISVLRRWKFGRIDSGWERVKEGEADSYFFSHSWPFSLILTPLIPFITTSFQCLVENIGWLCLQRTVDNLRSAKVNSYCCHTLETFSESRKLLLLSFVPVSPFGFPLQNNIHSNKIYFYSS